MPKTRTIVPTTHPKTGEPVAAGAEIDLDDEAYADLRSRGAVEASEQEQREHATPEAQGNYSARVGRSDVGEAAAPRPVNAPRKDDDDDDEDEKPAARKK